ncbi:hypothetical protein BKA59DRAFT_466066 [Fusarium tricinctum]|uniref:NADP-dependent oxidoreductase domain-containing protein n=1 Tax=Fusarium tricinctum TaxID=61284 RepID=A0A8K0SEP6_9HYPO|nr:hypothetical protein BKA59DRAFT_466066 [Fusarium tricinctum]
MRWKGLANIKSSFYHDDEEIIGKWLKLEGKRDGIFLATKFGYVKEVRFRSSTFRMSYQGSLPRYTKSLRLLDFGCIVLFYAHTPSPETSIEQAMRF